MTILTLLRARRSTAALVLAAGLLTQACVDDPTPPTSLEATGRVAGIVFFDRDNNGAFTPAGGDSVMPDVNIEVRARGTTTALVSLTSDLEGRFSSSVPVGTHDIAVLDDAAIVAAGLVWCGARPSVYANEQAFVPTGMKFGCVIRIEDAKQEALATTVTIAGIVTAQPGRFRNDNLYMQDPSGGIQVFGVPSALGLVEGDSVEVTGELGAFNGQLQIVAPRFAANVTSGVALPDPVELTTAQAATQTTGLSANIGRLVQVRGVTVGAFASGNASMDDGSGASLLRLDNNANANIGTATFVAGRCYDITGILGFFNGASQLQPRTLSDVTEVSCS